MAPELHPDGRCVCCDAPLVNGSCVIDVLIAQELSDLYRFIAEGLVSDFEAFMLAGRIPAVESMHVRALLANRSAN